MPKYEIYQCDKLLPLTIVEADDWGFTGDNCLRFYNKGELVKVAAVFNFDDIAGVKVVTE